MSRVVARIEAGEAMAENMRGCEVSAISPCTHVMIPSLEGCLADSRKPEKVHYGAIAHEPPAMYAMPLIVKNSTYRTDFGLCERLPSNVMLEVGSE